jgi:hypothetical protein
MNSARSPLPSPWLVAAGAGLLVFAARAVTMHRGAGAAPFLDQWLLEADQVIVPWLNGQLAWTSFLAPHHEHLPVWTRVLAWLQAALLRTWDPLMQGTVNALLFGCFVGSVTAWLARHFSRLATLAAGALLVTLYSLPHSWENTIWGLQSSVPLCLLFSFWHLRGSLQSQPGTRGWWLAQLAGLAALGSFGSAWAAPLAAAAVMLWTDPRSWRRWLAPALLAALGLGLLVFALQTQPREGALALHAPNFTRFLGGWVLQAGWPSGRAFAPALIFLPAFLLLLRIRGQRGAAPPDLVALGLALFGLAQAAAFSVGRSAEYVGFVSRYTDFLALGVFANGLVLWRLGAARHIAPWLAVLIALPWLATLATGLRDINRTGHTLHFQQNAAAWRAHREGALQRYLATRDIQHLRTEAARAHLYPAPGTVARALETPGFAALLPAGLRGPDNPRPGDAAGLAVRFMEGVLPCFTWAGIVLILLSLASPWPMTGGAASPPRWPTRPTAPALGVGLACSAAVFLWPQPWRTDAEARLIAIISSPDAVPDLAVRIVTPSPYPPDNLVGGAALWPEHFRNLYFGTHIDGPAFTGRAESSVLKLTSPFLVVAVAGFPATAGNSLLLEVLDADGRVSERVRYAGPNPDATAFWSLDVAQWRGREARFAIEDGHASGLESWVAFASPLRAPRDLGPTLTARWAAEQTASARVSLALCALAAFAVAGAGAVASRRHP